jgi:hypothetical protein
MDFKKYLAESQKVYNYRIKTASPLTSEIVAQIAAYLTKFRLLSISKPSRSILQKNPLDFSDLQNVEVYMIDVATTLPCSSYIMQQDIRNIMNIPEKYVVVRCDNEPIEIEGNRIAQERELEANAEKKGLEREPLLSTDSVYSDAEQTADGQNYYGNDYNNRLLSYLKTLQAEHQPEQVDAPAPLFAWMDMPKNDVKADDFNRDIKVPKTKKQDADAKEPAPTGNYDNSGDTVKHTYLTKGGKQVVKASTPNTIRKG